MDFLHRALSVAGPMTRKEIWRLVEYGNLKAAFASPSKVDSALKKLVGEGRLTAQGDPGWPWKFEARQHEELSHPPR